MTRFERRIMATVLAAAYDAQKAEPFSTFTDIVIATASTIGRDLDDAETSMIWTHMFDEAHEGAR